jgi:uncharacterized protein YijF (DUF1287 family)
MYTNEDFGINKYTSLIDKDNDGIDDQTDILNNVRKYIDTNPKYQSKYYDGGYPIDNYGVCTDVVAFGMLGTGYDLRKLLNEDVKNNRTEYNIKEMDINIDFRRVLNIDKYLKRNHISLTTDITNIKEWQGGDIVVFSKHIGVVSDKRNKNGVPFLIHHAYPNQLHLEEDVLESYTDIIGHYRLS